MKVSLFIPCLTEHFYPETALSMVKVLRHVGATIDYVDGQTCCGQPAFNSGYRRYVIPLAQRFIELFQDKEIIVAPSGSCVAMVRKFYFDLDLDPKWHQGRAEVASKIYEFSEYLVDFAGIDNLGGSFSHTVTYHDSCHLKRELGVDEQPRRLIRSINGIHFIEMEKPDLCCGFGGTFSYKFKQLSTEMVARKCRYIEESDAEFCIGADSSCLMNIEGYLRKHQMKAKTMHLADLLALSLGL